MDREMRQVLAELEICSSGTTSSWDSSHGAFGSREPRSGDADPPFVLFRDAWLAEDTERGRERVLHEARRELKALRRREAPVVEESREDRDKRIRVLAGQGWDEKQIAQNVRCGVTDVRKAMREPGDVDGDTTAQVRALAERGMSQMRIAQLAKINQSTVSRILAR